MADKLIIKKRGSDGYKTFSIRIKEETVERIDEMASKTERSRNELIGTLLEYALENSIIQ
ncbi:MAG: CopG family transcriptional regulator [Butyrivibrio sp.]|jgi:predicted transcriptional regulator|uniref:ribbon-helix-helix protein, CopG family n=1 Tax=Butyrivibrio sp. TaxID=28121 RepID=UPI001EC25D3D|nr:ribbon-helix-helix protein, CopG family [Butyrivibrio sp.]MBE5842275.1 CopG family transcriptional regulator [Butyrivibrio sp.]